MSFLKQDHVKINNGAQVSTFVYLLNIDRLIRYRWFTLFKRILFTTASFIHNYLSVKKHKSIHPMFILVAGERNITCNYIMCIFFIRSLKLFSSRSLPWRTWLSIRFWKLFTIEYAIFCVNGPPICPMPFLIGLLWYSLLHIWILCFVVPGWTFLHIWREGLLQNSRTIHRWWFLFYWMQISIKFLTEFLECCQ